jgi:hypothetical protein
MSRILNVGRRGFIKGVVSAGAFILAADLAPALASAMEKDPHSEHNSVSAPYGASPAIRK